MLTINPITKIRDKNQSIGFDILNENKGFFSLPIFLAFLCIIKIIIFIYIAPKDPTKEVIIIKSFKPSKNIIRGAKREPIVLQKIGTPKSSKKVRFNSLPKAINEVNIAKIPITAPIVKYMLLISKPVKASCVVLSPLIPIIENIKSK